MKNTSILKKRIGLLSPLLGVLISMPTFSEEIDPEWPCIQRLIPEVSAAVFWPVPVEDPASVQYKNDDTIVALAEELGDIGEFTDEHRKTIEQFAQSIPEVDRESKLTELAFGILAVSNRLRADYIRGIKRYTRQQIDIALQIEEALNTLSLMEGKDSSNEGQSRLEIEETLRWHERVYDQRERSIQSLCETPVELEQRLSEVLREIAQFLP